MKQKDVLRQHIEVMKCREQEQIRLRNEATTKYETIMHERMELEDFLSALDEKNDSERTRFESLMK